MLTANLYRTPYGDITMRVVPAAGSHTYTLRIKSIDATATLREVTASAPDADGFVWLDYPVDQSCNDYGIAYPPSYLRYELLLDGAVVQGTDVVVPLAADDTVVKTRIGIIGQSNGEQHFSYLSNGYTHIGNASATALRNAYAAVKGVRPVTVQPINLAVGGSAAHAGTAPSYAPSYFWWDLAADRPGPCYAGFAGDAVSAPLPSIAERLAAAVDGSVSRKLDALVVSHGEQDATAGGSAVLWRAAWEKVIARLKVDAGNPALPVWYQALGRLYMDMAGTPRESLGAFTKAIRDAQVAHARADALVHVGAWPAGTAASVIYDGVHYTAATYHAIAAILGARIAGGVTVEDVVPDWATYPAPDVVAVKDPATGDITYTFSNLSPGCPYRWRHTMVTAPGYTIAEASFTPSRDTYQFTWSAASQAAVYGYPAGAVNVRAWRHESDANFGADGEFVGAV